MKTIFTYLVSAWLLLWTFTPCSQGALVAVSNEVGDTLVTSNGTTELGTQFVFEIGAFATGFVPTIANVDLWEANWKAFARATDGYGWNDAFNYFGPSANLNSDGTSSAAISSSTFAMGEQLYLWVYDTRINSGEWALVTNDSSDGSSADNWVFPDPSSMVGGAGSYSLLDATVPIVGGVNGEYGGGIVTGTPGNFHLQTAIVAVPEPGSVLMVMTAGLGLGLRRRRRSI